jgi:hypothetical protein
MCVGNFERLCRIIPANHISDVRNREAATPGLMEAAGAAPFTCGSQKEPPVIPGFSELHVSGSLPDRKAADTDLSGSALQVGYLQKQ